MSVGRKHGQLQTGGSEFSDSYDSASEEEKQSFLEEEEAQSLDENNIERFNAFLETIAPAYQEMIDSGKPLEYFKAEKLIRRLATFALVNDQDAVRAVYFARLEKSKSNVLLLKKFISELKLLIFAAESTEETREYWLGNIEDLIFNIKTVETTYREYIENPQAEVYRKRLELISSNPELETLYRELTDAWVRLQAYRNTLPVPQSPFLLLDQVSSNKSGFTSQSPSPLAEMNTFARRPLSPRAQSAPLPSAPHPPARRNSFEL